VRQTIREAVSEIERDWERQLVTRRFATLKSLLRELYDTVKPT
jgi:hypothetical protein